LYSYPVDPSPALRLFLDRFFDYAGLFPPASLSLEAAVAEYAAHAQGDEQFMLSRFVLSATQLEALAALPGPYPPRLSLLAGAPQAHRFWEDLEAALGHVQVCFPNGNVQADAVEVRVPDAFLDDPGLFSRATEASSPFARPVYLEVPLLHPNLSSFARAVKRAAGWRLGLKFRTGGLTPDLIPSSSALAAGLVAVRDAGLAFKCTAGLHHPIRAYHEAFGGRMHGFVNVFGAAMLAYAFPDLGAAPLCEVLDETDPAAFTFTDGFAWRDRPIPPDVLADLRSRFAHGVGSCSISEPLADLKALTWL